MECGEAVERACLRAGGRNPNGEPNFRLIRAREHLEWACGKWVDHDGSGNQVREVFEARYVPAYSHLPPDVWVLEKWLSPEAYAGPPSKWYEMTRELEGVKEVGALGPYPHRGEYELCRLADCDLVFVRVPPITILERMIWAVRFGERLKLNDIRDREQKKGEDYEIWAYETLRNELRPFCGQTFVTVPGGTNESTKRITAQS